MESETSTNAAAATKTWIYVEPYLFKNASSGRYYSRFFRQGFRALRTNRVTVARLRLADRVRDYKGNSRIQSAAENGDVTMEQVIALFESATVENPSLSASTKKDRRICLLRLQKTWPKLGLLKPRQITTAEINSWAARAAKFSAKPPPGSKTRKGAFSHRALQKSAGVLRMVLKHALTLNAISSVPSFAVFPGGKCKVPVLPSRRVVGALFNEIQYPRNAAVRDAVRACGGMVEGKTQQELADQLGISLATLKRHKTGGVGNGKDAADFARLLVFTGMRVDEARRLTWGDVDFENGRIRVQGTKTDTSRRTIPMIPECRDFLVGLVPGSPTDRVSRVDDINRALAGASKRLGVSKLTHHSMRHLFATLCIESGVDIPTVSRWLGHADGGALAMRVYGHLRDEHSQIAAAKVRVLTPPSG
ncbi:MAG: tyrosine-type recombinase/integrase [Opitutaceae bacterium]|nr:tyrosine-type recombinase/integrase [Opitutaceae bacterium]